MLMQPMVQTADRSTEVQVVHTSALKMNMLVVNT